MASVARSDQRALKIPFVARRGEHPRVLIGSGSGRCFSVRSISSPGSGGRVATLSVSLEVLHAHSAVVVRSRSPWCASSRTESPLQTERPLSRGSAPQGCSRVRREIPSGRTGRIALSSECSYRFRRLHVSSHGIALLS
jgi:hypothetical protein